jgi:acyl-CoA thioester hydrolase
LKGCTVRIPVRFAECDPYGVVWHGHYALYLEQAREALTSRFGFTASTALALGYRVPITRMEIRYHLPIVADTVVAVTARLRPTEIARLQTDYEIRSESGQRLASAETEQVVLSARNELLLKLPGVLDRMVSEIVRAQDSLDPA